MLEVLLLIVELLLLVLAVLLLDDAADWWSVAVSISVAEAIAIAVAVGRGKAVVRELAWDVPPCLLARLPLLSALLPPEQLGCLLLASSVKECLHFLGVDPGRDGLADGPLVLVVEGVVHLVFVELHIPRLLQLLGLLLLLVLVVGLRELGVDDGEEQVQKEEGAGEDHRDENDEGDVVEGTLHHALDVGPALEGDALEHVKEGVLDRVEVGDSEVGVVVLLAAEVAAGAACARRAAKDVVGVQRSGLDRYATLFQGASQQLETADRKHDEKEEQDQQSVSQQRDSRQEGHDKNP